MKFTHLMTASILAVTLAACNNVATDNVKDKGQAVVKIAQDTSAKPVRGTYGIATENMDQSVKPGDNFFKFVNGTWLKETEIPADKDN